MGASESLSFNSVDITFDENFLDLMAGPDHSHGRQQSSLRLRITCKRLDWQVASAVQIFDSISPVLSRVEELTLGHVARNRSSDPHDKVDRTQWRKLFRSFSNVKSLGLPESLSRSFLIHYVQRMEKCHWNSFQICWFFNGLEEAVLAMYIPLSYMNDRQRATLSM
ncbi:hypothetical protein BGW80DRAFT_400435 [Lactifluus volemus]|nr:hypothetical protein BGW80DRAFT_400435 [Lactifluus volemus]